MADSTPHQNQLGTRLQEIADALGIPVSWLHEGRVPPFANEAFDLLRLYAAITDGQGRQRVMTSLNEKRSVARQRMRRNPDWGCGSLAHPSTGKPMMTAVLTIARRRPGAVASSASSFFACGCMSIARPTSIRWPDEKTNGGGALVLHVGVCCILDLRIRDLGFAAQVADAGDLSGHAKGVACAGRRVEA